MATAKRHNPANAGDSALAPTVKNGSCAVDWTMTADHLMEEFLQICGTYRWQIVTNAMRSAIRLLQDKFTHTLLAQEQDYHFHTLFKSNHIVFREVLGSGACPELNRGFEKLLELLSHLDCVKDIDSSRSAANHDLAEKHISTSQKYFYGALASRFMPVQVLMFMLQLSYLRIEDRVRCGAIDQLLTKYRVLNLLESYRFGVADVFIQQNGEKLFAGGDDLPFINRYYCQVAVQPGDTLRSFAKRRWGHLNWPFVAVEPMLRAKNPGIRTLDPDSPIPGKATFLEVFPPADQEWLYRKRVGELLSQEHPSGSTSNAGSSGDSIVVAWFRKKVLPKLLMQIEDYEKGRDPTEMFNRVADIVSPLPTRELSSKEVANLLGWLNNADVRYLTEPRVFCESVNRMLKASGCRIFTKVSRTPCLLRVDRRKYKNKVYDYIRFSSGDGDIPGTLGKTPITIKKI